MSALTGHYALVITGCVLMCQEHTDVHAEMVIMMLMDYVKVANTLLCVCVREYLCGCICMHICMDMCVCYVFVCVCVCVSVSVSVSVCACVFVCLCACMHICAY